MKIMSFNVCSLRTWGGFDSAEWLEWKRSLKEFVECNNVDVVMLQEVYKMGMQESLRAVSILRI